MNSFRRFEGWHAPYALRLFNPFIMPVSNPHILLVEDDFTDAELIQRSLHWHNPELNIRWIDDSDEALRHLMACERGEALLPQLMIMDLKMPKRSGSDLLAELAELTLWPTLTVVVLSSSPLEEDLTRIRSLGVEEYYVKPMELHELRLTAQQILTRWGLC
mgnify:CR=1 FL=1